MVCPFNRFKSQPGPEICDVISAKRYGTALFLSIPPHPPSPAPAANFKEKGFFFVITTRAAIYSVIQKGYQFPFSKDFSTEAVSTIWKRITEHTCL